MKIALRKSGGRGEYEVAGHQGDAAASDLYEMWIAYEFSPDLVLPGFARAQLKQGKPRIRLKKGAPAMHAHRLFSAVLLLPPAKREIATTPGGPLQISTYNYSISEIQVDLVQIERDYVVLRPTFLRLCNSSNSNAKIDVVERMSQVFAIWEAASLSDSKLARVIQEHNAALAVKMPNYLRVEKLRNLVLESAATSSDPLGPALALLELCDEGEKTPSFPTSDQEEGETVFKEEDDTDPADAKRQALRRWRLVAQRGAKARKFSKQVRDVYDHTCLFTGMRLPKLESTDLPGVDAAHILPWRSYELSTVKNGLCLSKDCHWAFDNGILRVDSDGENYHLSIPEGIEDEAREEGFDLKPYQDLTGILPRRRLPHDTRHWPHPDYLRRFNYEFYGG